ncbi:MAG TPA: RNA polymerase sigma factor [Actinomycetota bacterium]
MELSVPQTLANISPRSLDRKIEDPDTHERERALVSRAQGGDREAFGELYRTHAPAVARLVRFRMGTEDEDAVAEVFFRAWRGLGGYRDTGVPFSAWLYGIARHVAIDELRKRHRAEPTDELPDREVEPMTDDLLTLRGAIDQLPTEQRQVIELKYLVGLTNDEVASAMGCTPGAVNAKQWRALRALANEMGAAS